MKIITGGTNDRLHLAQMHSPDNYTKKQHKCNRPETKVCYERQALYCHLLIIP